jgi:hypothetical protein
MEKRESKLLFSINNVKNFSDTEDILIIGNTYKIFSKNTINFYFPLLKLQYLFEVERDIDKVRKE